MGLALYSARGASGAEDRLTGKIPLDKGYFCQTSQNGRLLTWFWCGRDLALIWA